MAKLKQGDCKWNKFFTLKNELNKTIKGKSEENSCECWKKMQQYEHT